MVHKKKIQKNSFCIKKNSLQLQKNVEFTFVRKMKESGGANAKRLNSVEEPFESPPFSVTTAVTSTGMQSRSWERMVGPQEEDGTRQNPPPPPPSSKKHQDAEAATTRFKLLNHWANAEK